MVKLLIINVTWCTPQNRVGDIITYVIPNTINGVRGVVEEILSRLKLGVSTNKETTLQTHDYTKYCV
jgi:hypothetical protein